MADSTIDIKVDLNFRLNIVKESSINLIESVTESEKKDRESFSIIVYYARVGDTLWKIAKKFGSTVDEIVKVNGIENPDVIMQESNCLFQDREKLWKVKFIQDQDFAQQEKATRICQEITEDIPRFLLLQL